MKFAVCFVNMSYAHQYKRQVIFHFFVCASMMHKTPLATRYFHSDGYVDSFLTVNLKSNHNKKRHKVFASHSTRLFVCKMNRRRAFNFLLSVNFVLWCDLQIESSNSFSCINLTHNKNEQNMGGRDSTM